MRVIAEKRVWVGKWEVGRWEVEVRIAMKIIFIRKPSNRFENKVGSENNFRFKNTNNTLARVRILDLPSPSPRRFHTLFSLRDLQ